MKIEEVKAIAITRFLKALAFYIKKRRHLSCGEARVWYWLIQPIGKLVSQKGVAQ
jgi:hypothetical protein